MPEKDKASVRETPRTSNKKNSSKRSQEKIKLGPALNVDTVINLSSENFEIGETASPNGEISDLEIARKLIKISQSAQDRKLSFNLTFDTMKKLLSYKTCFYTGRTFAHGEKSIYARSIDRVNSSIGYVEGNVVACTVDINQKKSNLTFEEISCLYHKIIKHEKSFERGLEPELHEEIVHEETNS